MNQPLRRILHRIRHDQSAYVARSDHVVPLTSVTVARPRRTDLVKDSGDCNPFLTISDLTSASAGNLAKPRAHAVPIWERTLELQET